jgi:hypothetical protein
LQLPRQPKLAGRQQERDRDEDVSRHWRLPVSGWIGAGMLLALRRAFLFNRLQSALSTSDRTPAAILRAGAVRL